MPTVIRSGRFYFWPIIAANIITMTLAIGGDPTHAAIFSIVISSLASFGFLLNDLWDRDIDRVNGANHFEYSLPPTLRIGVAASGIFLFAGLGVAFKLGLAEFFTACGIAIALAAYSLLLRKYLFIPTIIAAVLASSPLWIPLVLWAKDVDRWKYLFIASVILIIAAREIFMDTRDQAGDLAGFRYTFATVFGNRISKLTAVMLTSSASILLFVVVAHSSSSLPLSTKFCALLTTVAIMLLLLLPSLLTLTAVDNEKVSIQKYVLRSRAAMTLIPLLNLFLWYL